MQGIKLIDLTLVSNHYIVGCAAVRTSISGWLWDNRYIIYHTEL